MCLGGLLLKRSVGLNCLSNNANLSNLTRLYYTCIRKLFTPNFKAISKPVRTISFYESTCRVLLISEIRGLLILVLKIKYP